MIASGAGPSRKGAADVAAAPEVWRQQGTYVEWAGPTLFATAVGDGSPVLVLHGFPTASYDFSRVVPLLARHYRLILFDYPGFGFSDKPRGYPYSLFAYADAAQAVAEHFGLARVRLLAHDIGDSVALELLARRRLTVERLVMLNGSVLSIPLADPVLLAAQRLSLNRRTGPLIDRLRLIRKPVFARQFGKLFPEGLPARDLDSFWSLLQFNDGLRNYHHLLRYMEQRWAHQHRWLDALAEHPAPLTLVWGMADPVATSAVAEHVLSRRLDARLVPLEGIGHCPHWTAADATAGAVLAGLG